MDRKVLTKMSTSIQVAQKRWTLVFFFLGRLFFAPGAKQKPPRCPRSCARWKKSIAGGLRARCACGSGLVSTPTASTHLQFAGRGCKCELERKKSREENPNRCTWTRLAHDVKSLACNFAQHLRASPNIATRHFHTSVADLSFPDAVLGVVIAVKARTHSKN